MVIQPRREGRKEEMVIQPRRGGRKEEMVIDTLQPCRGRRKEEMVVTVLPFPMSIPVDDNDLKSLELSVDVVSTIGGDTEPVVADSRTLVAPESASLIGGDTAQTADVSDLPQRTEGGVTDQTETASRSPSTQDFSDGTRVPKRKPKPEQVGNSKEIFYVPHLYFSL